METKKDYTVYLLLFCFAVVIIVSSCGKSDVKPEGDKDTVGVIEYTEGNGSSGFGEF